MPKLDRKLVRLTTATAAVGAAIVAVLPPLASYHFAYQRHLGAVEIATAVLGHHVSEFVARNPELWMFETARIEQALIEVPFARAEERREVRTTSGEEVSSFSQGASTPWPVITRTEEVADSGRPVGIVEVRRSLRQELLRTVAVGALSSAIATIAFFVLRLLPLRALRQAVARARYLASHDALTGLPNRNLFRERLAERLSGLGRDGGMLAVLFLDLDRFKEVNDTLGHAIGDRLLIEVAGRIRAILRSGDTLARLGGDEFAVLQTGGSQPAGAERLARAVLDAVQAAFLIDGQTVSVGVSVGIALAAGPGETAEQILQRADLALYRVKEEGRGAFRFFEEEMNERSRARRALEADLREALAENQFEVHYQPQLDLETGEMKGAEALLRWTHPERGRVPPDNFITLAEEIGLIVPIGAWVLEQACTVAATWPHDLSIAVNLSPAQMKHDDLPGLVKRVLAQTGLDPRRLELEITEGMLLNDTAAALATLEALRAMGVRIAMDDFGTGYSSLSYLRRFPFDKVKIDRSFTSDLDRREDARAIVKAIVSLSRALGIRANAEGVETLAQAHVLMTEGCDEAQGYLYGRPCDADAMAGLISSRAAVADVAIVEGLLDWRPQPPIELPREAAEAELCFNPEPQLDPVVAAFLAALLADGLDPDRHREYGRWAIGRLVPGEAAGPG